MKTYPNHILYLLFFVCAWLPFNVQAQNNFTEGSIIYNVTIEPLENPEGIVQHKGTYTITIKGKELRKELKMDNGFHNIMLITNNGMYALRNIGEKNIAIQLDNVQVAQKNKRYGNYKLNKQEEKKTIINLPGEKATIVYEDGSQTNIYYTNEWHIEDFVFDRFPAIKYLPLQFNYKNDEGMLMNFSIKKIEQKPIENTAFSIPKDYKVMTSEEYKQLNR